MLFLGCSPFWSKNHGSPLQFDSTSGRGSKNVLTWHQKVHGTDDISLILWLLFPSKSDQPRKGTTPLFNTKYRNKPSGGLLSLTCQTPSFRTWTLRHTPGVSNPWSNFNLEHGGSSGGFHVAGLRSGVAPLVHLAPSRWRPSNPRKSLTRVAGHLAQCVRVKSWRLRIQLEVVLPVVFLHLGGGGGGGSVFFGGDPIFAGNFFWLWGAGRDKNFQATFPSH